MKMLSEPVVLMLLPACLVFLGVFIGFVLWSWARGIDNQALEDLHDDIRRLGSRLKERSNPSDLLDLQFENDELRSQCESLTNANQEAEMHLTELKSEMQVRESEIAIAEKTILQLREQLLDVNNIQESTEETTKSYQFVTKPIFRPQLLVTEDPSVEKPDSEKPEPANEPTILRPNFESFEKSAVEGSPTATLDIEYGGQVRHDEVLGLVYSRPPMINDNLQLISGIASKLEQQLNGYGVYTFQQIMLWNSQNIDAFSNLLDTFQDRIERDDWVGQAKTMYGRSRSMRNAA